MGNTQDLGARNTCPPLPKRAATVPLCCVCSGQPKPGTAACPRGKALWTVLVYTPFPLKSIYLLMFKNTQLEVWVAATSCPSPSTVFITTGAVVKATIAPWGVQGSVLTSIFVKEKHKQTPPWQRQALCLLFLQSFQLRSNLNLTLSCGLMLFSLSLASWRQVWSCSPLTWSHDWGPSPVLGMGLK